ncbi:branched-chain amino acid ABC transporter permease [Micromonospora sp. DR5-3]|uniref:branched-chain amino acid ABC transporter permease n=1 Tax=unclassified Micromonospora TaxID=2617518 RepID=UPI001651D53C|nr:MULTISPECIES: branched-chain amino acid ABC transporter permease [unclassified Micromonospora]MCW3817960.1 branched-chain amino acid ABC transporter permease [Micromonospora sp. DR5-3]
MSEPRRRRLPGRGQALTVGLLVVAVATPFYVGPFWLQVGLTAMAYAVAAIGLAIQVGVAGQLSLAHAVFMGSGAYLYSFLGGASTGQVTGLGWPPWLAALGAIVLTALLGALCSPISARLRGLYLGVASLGLVFIASHVMQRFGALTGGPGGREVPPLRLGPLDFSDDTTWVIANVPFHQAEKLWMLGLAVLAGAYLVARRMVAGRGGLALHMMRDSEIGAAAMGITVWRYKASAFVIAAVYGATGGVLLALLTGWVVPESFGFDASVNLLIMVVIGGLGSIRGAIPGAVFVSALPLLIARQAQSIPLISGTGDSILGPGTLSTFLYAGLFIVTIMFASGGLDRLVALAVGTRRPQRRIAGGLPGKYAQEG